MAAMLRPVRPSLRDRPAGGPRCPRRVPCDPHTDDNYFVAPGGLGPGPYPLRVSDVHGHALEDRAIALGDGTGQPGAAQFPSCP
jgi:hypothetical protein